MAIQSQAQLDAFKTVALQQGYDPKEVDSFMAMATAANAQKQAAADQAKKDELADYEAKLQLQQKYSKSAQPEEGGLTEMERAAITAGKATIGYDEKTGKYKVNPQTGDNPANPSVSSYVDLFKKGAIKSITNIPASSRDDVVVALSKEGVNPIEIERKNAVKGVVGVINTVKNLYENNTSDVTKDDLSRGRIGGILSSIGGKFGMAPRATVYKDTLNGVLASLKAATGDTGVMTDQDADRLRALLPSVNSTPQEAALKWQQVDQFLQNKFGVGLSGNQPGLNLNSNQETSKPGLNLGGDPLGLGF